MSKLTLIANGERKIIEYKAPRPLSDILAEEGIFTPHPCGKRGVCGKCTVNISGDVSAPVEREIEIGARLSCKTTLLGDAELILDTKSVEYELHSEKTDLQVKDGLRLGAAIDIGTTTVVAAVYDLDSKRLLGKAQTKNRGTAIASDVMGRIEAACNGDADSLSSYAQDTVNALIDKITGGKGRVERRVTVGNTAMLYLALKNGYPRALAGTVHGK